MSPSSKKATKKASRKRVAAALPYVIRDKYLQVTVGKPPRSFSLNSTHPTFERLKAALERGSWSYVPKLISLAENLKDASNGSVEVKRGVVFYKGREVDSSLTRRIVDMINEGHEVKHMLRFMENLFENPSHEAREEFYKWLRDNHLPLTDDGCFLGYKWLDDDLKDNHSHSIDMSPGQRVIGSRKWFDTSYRTLCSKGYHICSKAYGSYGTRCVAVKVNPRDVLSAPAGDHKIRVVTFESIRELGSKNEDLFRQEGFKALEDKILVEVKKQRRELLEMVLKHRTVKKHIKQGKLKAINIAKRNFGSLMKFANSYNIIMPDLERENITKEGTPFLRSAREQSGLTIGQMAKQMDQPYTTVAKLEKMEIPPLDQRDEFIAAIATLTRRDHQRRDLSFKVENIEVKIPEVQ